MNIVRGYIFSRPFMGERVPQHVQNLVIRDYCERNKLQLLLSATEYAMHGSHLIFEQILCELSGIQGLVAYSLFQLPENEDRRRGFYQQLLEQNKCIHFAVEGFHANTQNELERIETLWCIRQTLPHCARITPL
jgi:sporadic carbohydrate cluster protein (TIGR04323 family)